VWALEKITGEKLGGNSNQEQARRWLNWFKNHSKQFK